MRKQIWWNSVFQVAFFSAFGFSEEKFGLGNLSLAQS